MVIVGIGVRCQSVLEDEDDVLFSSFSRPRPRINVFSNTLSEP